MERFWDENDTIAIAVSGGVDSMVLLDKIRISRSYEQLYVLHVNHQLRTESIEEERMVQRYCEQHSIECIVYRIPEGTFDGKRSIQEPARKIRYDFFRRAAEEKAIDWILTAHHYDDQIETIMFRLLTNRFTFQSPRMHIVQGDKPCFGKPLIHYTKDALYEYAAKHHVPYMEDVSNHEVKYTRNYIRHEIIDNMEHANLSKENIMHVAAYIDDAQSLVAQVAERYETEVEQNMVTRQRLMRENKLVQQYVVKALIHKVVIDETISIRQIDEIIRVLKSDTTHASYVFGKYVLYITYEALTIKTITPIAETIHITSPGKYKFNEYIIKVNTIKSDIIVRSRQSGDTLLIDGHRQKVSRIMKDNKVPKHERQMMPIVLCEGAIIAVGNLKSNNHLMNQYITILKEY